MSEARLRAEMVEVGRRLYQARLVAGSEGNISCRLGEWVLATPSGTCKGFLKPEQLVLVDLNGQPVRTGSQPVAAVSSEIRIHLAVYRHRPDVQAVVHAHPVYATAFAMAGQPLNHRVHPEAVVLLGPIPLVPYGTPSTDELSQALTPYVADHDAFLLANHGALTVGGSLAGALYRMESLERLAQVSWLAVQLGGPRGLTQAQLDQLAPVRQRFLAGGGHAPSL